MAHRRKADWALWIQSGLPRVSSGERMMPSSWVLPKLQVRCDRTRKSASVNQAPLKLQVTNVALEKLARYSWVPRKSQQKRMVSWKFAQASS